MSRESLSDAYRRLALPYSLPKSSHSPSPSEMSVVATYSITSDFDEAYAVISIVFKIAFIFCSDDVRMSTF
jgi:hypothetical protein